MQNVSNLPVPAPTQSEVSRRDRIGLRAMVQETIHHFTQLRRREAYDDFLREQGRAPTESELDRIQPLIEEFDPVVELAIIGADARNKVELRRQALADAAGYLRPKLSAVQMLDDPETLQQAAQKKELAVRLTALMDVLVTAKRSSAADPEPSPSGHPD